MSSQSTTQDPGFANGNAISWPTANTAGFKDGRQFPPELVLGRSFVFPDRAPEAQPPLRSNGAFRYPSALKLAINFVTNDPCGA